MLNPSFFQGLCRSCAFCLEGRHLSLHRHFQRGLNSPVASSERTFLPPLSKTSHLCPNPVYSLSPQPASGLQIAAFPDCLYGDVCVYHLRHKHTCFRGLTIQGTAVIPVLARSKSRLREGMNEHLDEQRKCTKVQGPALPLPGCVTFNKLPSFSGPQFS